MTTATGGTKDEDEIVTMDVVEDEPAPPRPPLVSEAHARIGFLGLAGVAGLALVATILAIVLAPPSALTWLILSLVVLAIVIAAEIVLFFLAKPRTS